MRLHVAMYRCTVSPDTELAGASNVAERIQEEVRELQTPHEGSDVAGQVTLSIGVACLVPSSTVEPSD